MSNLNFVKDVYAAFGAGDVPKVLGAMHPQIQWTETAGYRYGGVYPSPQGSVTAGRALNSSSPCAAGESSA
ncbi:MAG: hypothetical protein ACXVEF_42530 [Polyangiales bacterium]